jgi:hypothetical protein
MGLPIYGRKIMAPIGFRVSRRRVELEPATHFALAACGF